MMISLGKYFAPRTNAPPNLARDIAPPQRHALPEREVVDALHRLCAPPKAGRDCLQEKFQIHQVKQIAIWLHFLDIQAGRQQMQQWCNRPRIYIVLQNLNALSYMNHFVEAGITDIYLPFNGQTLPRFLASERLREGFLDVQTSVLTDVRMLEPSSGQEHGQHIHFEESAEEHIVSVQHLGQGGYGSVDVVVSRLSLRMYARKRTHRGRDSPESAHIQRDLINEIHMLQKLSHRHLTKIIGSYTDPRYIAYLMEPIAECNLYIYLTGMEHQTARATSLRHYFGCLAGALNYLHRNNIRHRDLKPQNILVKNSRVYLADFGAALTWSATSPATTQDRYAPKTPLYMAPEVDSRKPRNQASDMWSLGIIYLEMVTVLKNVSLPSWIDHLRKYATRARTEALPCRNVTAVKDWLEKLQHRLSDRECDAEVLEWTRSLLQFKPELRPKAEDLVKNISQSPFFREHCCFDCVNEFENLDYFYQHDRVEEKGRAHESHSPRDDRVHDAEVAALIGLHQPLSENISDKQTQTIQEWIAKTQSEHPVFDTCHDKTDPLNQWGFNIVHDGTTHSETQIEPTSTLEQADGPNHKVHPLGFMVQHDGDSSSESDSNASFKSCETEEKEYNGPLFHIVDDSSVESEDHLSIATVNDTPVQESLYVIEEESSAQDEEITRLAATEIKSVDPRLSECFTQTQIRYEVQQLPGIENLSSNSNAGQTDDAASLTMIKTLSSTDDDSFVEESVDEPGRPKTKLRLQLESDHESTTEADEDSVSSAEDVKSDSIDGSLPTQTFGPTPSPPPSHAFALRPILPTNSSPPKQTFPISGRFLDLDRLGPRPVYRSPPSFAVIGGLPNKHFTPKSAYQPASSPNKSTQKSAATRPLSEANVNELNEQTTDSRNADTKENSELFNAARYIEAAWDRIEAPDSIATSLMGDEDRFKLRNIHIRALDRGYLLLENYCKAGKSAQVKCLLEQSCNPGTRGNPRPKPLLFAIKGASARHNKCVRNLINHNCDVNAKYSQSLPIHWALTRPYFGGYERLLGLLLSAGADVNRKDSNDEYPLISLLEGSPTAPLEHFKVHALALILSPKVPIAVDINVRQQITRNTALHLAVKRVAPIAVAILLHRGADVNAKNASGTTPLLMAATQWRTTISAKKAMPKDHEMVLKYLLQAPQIRLDTSSGSLKRTALHFAAAAPYATGLKMLLARGANQWLCDKEGKHTSAILEDFATAGKAGTDVEEMRRALKEECE